MSPNLTKASKPITVTLEEDHPFLESGMPAILPFLMEEREDELYAEIYRGVEAEGRAFLETYKGHWFTDEALQALDKAIAPYLSKVGYQRERQGLLRYYDVYRMEDASSLRIPEPPTEEGVTVTLISDCEVGAQLENATTFDLAMLFERDLPCVILTVQEGDTPVVAAVAAVGDASPGQHLLELTVETAPRYRRKGYALAVTAKLTQVLLNRGFACAYCCSRWNRASHHIVKDLGYRHSGKFYAIAAYR